LVETDAKGAIEVGSTVGGRFEILSFIGKGGMATVYKARDLQSDKLVAVKLLSLDRVPDPQSIARFQQEVRAASLLDHPCLARVYESGVAESGQPYLVMDLIEGTTLASKIEKEAQLSLDETLKIFILVCDGLAYAHAHNILHRDLKPSNIMLTTSGDGSIGVKILDFGLAKFQQSSDDQSHHITRTGELVGSPLYMSPEQARGIDLDQRSDLYSLGCALYESLTGVPPHIGQSSISTLLKRVTDQPLSLSEGSLGRPFPQDAENIVLKLLNVDPAQRFQSALEVKEALVKLLNSKTGNELPASNSLVEAPMVRQPVSAKPTRDRSLKFILTVAVIVSTLGLIGAPYFYYSTNGRLPLKPSVNQLPTVVATAKNSSFDWTAHQFIARAELLKAERRFDESIKTFKRAIELYRTSLGPDSAEEEDAYEELADTCLSAQQQEEAYNALNNAFRIACKLPSSNDMRLPELMRVLAVYYDEQYHSRKVSTPDKAVQLFRHAATLYQRGSSDKNLEAARCLLKAGTDLCQLNRTAEAEEVLIPAISLFSTRHCTPSFPAQAQRTLACCFREEQKFSEALDCDSKGVALIEKIHPTPIGSLANHLNAVAFDHYQIAQTGNIKHLKNAQATLNQSLQLSKKLPAETVAQRITAFDLLGDVFAMLARNREAGAYEKAKNNYLEALTLNQTIPKRFEDWLGIRYEKLDRLELDQNHMETSLQFCDLSLKHPGTRARILVEDYLHEANVLWRKASFNWAEALCQRLLIFAGHHFGNNSLEYANVASELGQTYLAQKKQRSAKAYLDKALTIYTKLLGPTNEKTTFVANLLSNPN
jgi:serine/threonine protein kinase